MFVRYLWISALMVAGTVGAGLFGIPYVSARAGWLVALLYLALFMILLSFAHGLYLKTLERTGGRERLVGLAGEYFGAGGRALAFVAVVGGLLLALVAYLILGARFLELLFPALGDASGALFWIFASLPLLLNLRRLVFSEVVGAVAMAALIALIFLSASWDTGLRAPTAVPSELFLPFGVVLFALAGWTAVEPSLEYGKSAGLPLRKIAVAIAWGTFFSALLYVLFAAGIFGSASAISEDTLDGLGAWPFWKFGSLLALGLFAIWTSYVPISLEIKNALQRDLAWSEWASVFFVLAAPPLLVLGGLTSFLRAVGLAGGLFLSLQYLLILAVGARALALHRGAKMLIRTLSIIFVLAAVYEVYYFVVQ